MIESEPVSQGETWGVGSLAFSVMYTWTDHKGRFCRIPIWVRGLFVPFYYKAFLVLVHLDTVVLRRASATEKPSVMQTWFYNTVFILFIFWHVGNVDFIYLHNQRSLYINSLGSYSKSVDKQLRTGHHQENPTSKALVIRRSLARPWPSSPSAKTTNHSQPATTQITRRLFYKNRAIVGIHPSTYSLERLHCALHPHCLGEEKWSGLYVQTYISIARSIFGWKSKNDNVRTRPKLTISCYIYNLDNDRMVSKPVPSQKYADEDIKPLRGWIFVTSKTIPPKASRSLTSQLITMGLSKDLVLK